MDINLIRKLDNYLGPSICKSLLLVRSFFRWTKKTDSTLRVSDFKSILIVKFFGMGTILLASAVLRGLKKKYNAAKITILTLEENKELCQMLPAIDEVLCLEIHSIKAFLASFFKIIREFKQRDFALIIDLEFLTNFSALVTLLATLFSRTKIALGFNSPLNWRNRIHDINVSFDHSRHITKIFAKMINSIIGDEFELSFAPEKTALLEKMDANYMLKLLSVNEALGQCNFFVCLNINAGELCLYRRWPKEYFAQVANELLKRQNIALVLIGATKDVGYVSEFKNLLSPSARIIDVSAKTNIKELIGLFAKCNLLITNDSGPCHIAEIIGLPTISFFGPETPYLYGPLEGKHYVFYADLYCSPCLNIYNSKMSYCQDNHCLKVIKPERVLKVIEEWYLTPEHGSGDI